MVVTAIDTATGRHVFARSDKGDDGWVTSIISAEPIHRARLSLMAASFARGEPPDIRLNPHGRLAALIAPDTSPDDAAVSAEVAKGPTTANAAPGATPSGIGTGFFVNATDILTAAHVVADCGHVSLENGAALQVSEMNEALDLALLSSDQPSANWLVLGGLPDARLGEQVFALGYPYAGILSSRLTVTGGNVSALDGILPDESPFDDQRSNPARQLRRTCYEQTRRGSGCRGVPTGRADGFRGDGNAAAKHELCRAARRNDGGFSKTPMCCSQPGAPRRF